MSTWKDITGHKSHMLTAIECVGKNARGQSLWKCMCNCGNETTITIQKFGVTKSCGCLKHKTNHRFNDLTGMRFGSWQVLYQSVNRITPSGYSRTMWTCICDCGRIKDVDASNLLSGASVSCGCNYDSGKCSQVKGYRIERGYRYIFKPDYPGSNNGWVREHQFVYETETGTPIPKGYRIHHIDMDKQNNMMSNLYLCTNKKHSDAHNSLNMIIKQLMEKGVIGFADGKYYRIKEESSYKSPYTISALPASSVRRFCCCRNSSQNPSVFLFFHDGVDLCI